MGCEGGRGGRGVGRCTGEGRALQQPGRCSGGVGFAAGVVALPHGRGGAAVRGDPRVVSPPPPPAGRWRSSCSAGPTPTCCSREGSPPSI